MSQSKLFVLVRSDLSRSQQAVQAGHALAELCLGGPLQDWKNGTLVYLRVRDEAMLHAWHRKLGPLSKAFYEPDRGNQMTAIAFVGYGSPELDKLPLV